MRQTLFTDKKWEKSIFGPEVEWTAFGETASYDNSTSLIG